METRLPSPCLVVLIGPSSSGKSTWASTNFNTSEIVSSDELRSRVGIDEDDLQASKIAFQLLDTIVAERVARKLTTVIDTLGFDGDRREGWIALAHANGIPVYAITFNTAEADCLERNSRRTRPLSLAVVRKQVKTYSDIVPALDSEGYDAVLEQRPVRAVAAPIGGPTHRDRSRQKRKSHFWANGFSIRLGRRQPWRNTCRHRKAR